MAGASSLYNQILPDRSIRLLRFEDQPDQVPARRKLRFELSVVLLDQAPPYDALSYRWDDPDPNTPDLRVSCNGVDVHVGRNLYLGLHQIFVTPDRRDHLWVDFICIDQSNEREKQTQIFLMPVVYIKAHIVIIWLGPAIDADGSDLAMDLLPLLVSALNLVDEPYNPVAKRALNRKEVRKRDLFLRDWNSEKSVRNLYVWKLLRRPWFSRTWTLQEAALASDNSIVMCGTKSMPYSILRHMSDRAMTDTVGHWVAAQLSVTNRNETVDPENPSVHPFVHVSISSRMRRALESEWNFASGKSSIVRLLHSLRSLECTDPKDRIFGVSAFLPEALLDELRTRGPLSTEELYTRFAEIELGSNTNLSCLAAAGLCQQRRSYPLKYSAGLVLQLPTWVPDWTYRKINDSLFIYDLHLLEHHHRHLFEAATKMSPDVRITTDVVGYKIASVKGYVMDTICEVSKPYRVHVIDNTAPPEKKPEQVLNMLIDYKTQIDDFISLARQHFRTSGIDSDARKLTLIRQTLIGSMLPAAPDALSFEALLIRSRPEQIDPLFEGFEDNIEEMRQLRDWTLNPASAPAKQSSTMGQAEIAARNARDKLHYLMLSAVSKVCKGRRLFVTTNGGIGMGPDITQENDKVCVFHGSSTPSVIRPLTSQLPTDVRYNLVGECYMHGLMDGEVMEMKNLVGEYIHLL